MPELPQMQALAERLEAAIGGHRLIEVDPLGFTALKTVDARARRRRRRTSWSTSGGAGSTSSSTSTTGTALMMHLSQAGRVDIEERPKTTRPKGAVVRLRFATPDGEAGRAVLVREHGTERKAAWWVLAPGDVGPLEGLGPEPDSDEFAELVLHGTDSRRIHTWLRDQRTVAGVGRGYADDALWRARVSPYAKLGQLDDDHRAALLDAVRSVLARRPREGAGANRRPRRATPRHQLRGARPRRRPVPALRRDVAPGVVRVVRGRLLPHVPDGRQGPRRPSTVRLVK